MTLGRRYEFRLDDIVELLSELDRLLRDRGLSASIFVVGGAAVAMSGARGDRVTLDVDAMTRQDVVLDVAAELAQLRGLPTDWLNRRAGAWMPPFPAGALDPPDRPGLRVTYADAGYLLATKLIAQRAKDEADIVALAEQIGLVAATPMQLDAHVRRYYTDQDALELIVGGEEPDTELRLRMHEAARRLGAVLRHRTE